MLGAEEILNRGLIESGCGMEQQLRCFQFVVIRKVVSCLVQVAPMILHQGFNRSFCGRNGTVYGNGRSMHNTPKRHTDSLIHSVILSYILRRD